MSKEWAQGSPYTAGGLLFYLGRVAQQVHDGDGHEHGKADEAEGGPGIELHPGDGLGHRHRIGVQGTGHEAHVLAQGQHREAGHGVVAHGDEQAHDQRIEAVKLAEHTEHGAAQTKEDHQHRDEEHLPAAHFLHDFADTGVEGAGLHHDAEGPCAGEDDEDDVCRADTALVQRRENAQEAGGHGLGLVDGMIAPGDGHAPGRAVHINCLIIIGAGGNDPG